jgi:hypothetical protein
MAGMGVRRSLDGLGWLRHHMASVRIYGRLGGRSGR